MIYNTILSTNIILTTLSHLRYYLVSINLNYLYNFGFLLGVSIFMQTISGLFLTLIYYTQLQLYSNIYVMTYDYYYGYLYRNVHILLATIVNILLLVHIFKGLLYNNLSNQIYIHYSGYVLYLLLIVISYLGYILTYGQLSYWGATVIINLLPASLATLILGDYNISAITINRYLIFHIVLTLVLYVFIIIHIFYLHQLSSQSPLPVSILSSPASQLSITFQHFILKDLTSLIFLLFIFMSIALFILINLSHSMNLIPINPLSTPSHIVPEWYFLYLYSILKIIPSKMGGILTVVITILVILLLTTSNYSYNLYNTNSIAISNYNNIDTVIIIFLSYIYLSFIGLQLPIAPYLINLRYFLLYLPIPIIIISLLSTLPLNTYLGSAYRFISHLGSRLGSTLMTSNYISLISTTNHKRIGLYYLLTGAYIAILGIILSIIIRVELYCPDNNIINMSNVSFYNYTITNHGLLMLLFIVMPIVFGAYGNYLLVLTVGLIDIIFPRINNFGWLLLILSYVLIQFGILTEYLTGTGWTLYPPLSTITSTYLISTIFLALAISGVSSLLTSVNYLLLIPYLLHISDLLLISFLITALMILYTMPVLAGAFLLATSDILLSTSYFSNYGDPVLFQHLFWWFGHLSSTFGCPIKISLFALIALELNILLFVKDTIGCFSTLYSIVCLIVRIIKIGQSAANLMKSCYTYLTQEIPQDISPDLSLENQALSEEERDLLVESNDSDLCLDEGCSETTRENDSLNKTSKYPLSRSITNKPTLPKHRPHHQYPRNDEELGYYLAGLIDGDGYISNETSQPTITITFHKKDTFLAYKIKSILGYGLVRCYSSYSIYTITNREGLIKMIYLIHNKLRLYHKVDRLKNLIKRYNLPLIKSIPDNSNLTLTHYLAGLLDSDGSFSIRLIKRVRSGDSLTVESNRRGLKNIDIFEVRLKARVELNYLLGYNVVNKLKEDLDGSLTTRIIEYSSTNTLGARSSKSIGWDSVSFSRMYNLLIYLDRYHLCSKKYLEYLYLRKAYIIIQNNDHLTLKGQIKLSSYKKRVSELKHVK